MGRVWYLLVAAIGKESPAQYEIRTLKNPASAATIDVQPGLQVSR